MLLLPIAPQLGDVPRRPRDRIQILPLPRWLPHGPVDRRCPSHLELLAMQPGSSSSLPQVIHFQLCFPAQTLAWQRNALSLTPPTARPNWLGDIKDFCFLLDMCLLPVPLGASQKFAVFLSKRNAFWNGGGGGVALVSDGKSQIAHFRKKGNKELRIPVPLWGQAAECASKKEEETSERWRGASM